MGFSSSAPASQAVAARIALALPSAAGIRSIISPGIVCYFVISQKDIPVASRHGNGNRALRESDGYSIESQGRIFAKSRVDFRSPASRA
jgi:hypothetical protein